VRDMGEVQPLQTPQLTAAAIERERSVLQASERISGINDVALGTIPQESRTLGEVNLVAEQSFVRMEEVTRMLQESLEDLAQIIMKIWRNTVADQKGVPIPDQILLGLEARTTQIDGIEKGGTITADMLAGNFRYKPRGSVETADVSRQRSDYISFLQVLPQLAAGFPSIANMLHNNMRAAKALLAQAVRLFRIPDKQAFIGSEAQGLLVPPPPPMPPAAPGMPSGVPGAAPNVASVPSQPQAGGPMA
jgi:hypothetical protein